MAALGFSLGCHAALLGLLPMFGRTTLPAVQPIVVSLLGGSPVRIPSGKKVLYHAAATMAASNVLAIEEAAAQLLLSVGMKRGQATKALLTLTRQVLENMEHLGPRAAWTGPLSRGDFRVVKTHLEALREFPAEFALAHEVLNRLAARLLSQDAAGTLAKLDKMQAGTKVKAKATGGNA
jgi:predicted short-subunit dehydrogenase-like oxidoreductase (DUF2520 family)